MIIVVNLFIHVILYSYYALYELKIDIWWKKVRGQDADRRQTEERAEQR